MLLDIIKDTPFILFLLKRVNKNKSL